MKHLYTAVCEWPSIEKDAFWLQSVQLNHLPAGAKELNQENKLNNCCFIVFTEESNIASFLDAKKQFCMLDSLRLLRLTQPLATDIEMHRCNTHTVCDSAGPHSPPPAPSYQETHSCASQVLSTLTHTHIHTFTHFHPPTNPAGNA